MSVQKFLDKIKNGRYGADITDAIIGGIKKCYDDASVNHDNANMEVKMARGTHNTLNDRLDKSDEIQAQTNAQLSKSINYVTYEMFGAVGNGVVDDYEAIYAAHVYANTQKISVVANGEKTYYIGDSPKPIPIKTNVDFNGANFIIDDTVELTNRAKPLFAVERAQIPITLSASIVINRSTRQLDDLAGYGECLVEVINSTKKQYIRKGSNANSGRDQQDFFICDNGGNILNDIVWDFDAVTSVILYPIEKEVLEIKNGNFTKIHNNLSGDSLYHERGILVNRSNVVIKNLSCDVQGDTGVNQSPYNGFVHTERCAYFKLENCYFKPIASSVNSSDVDMGTYQIKIDRTVRVMLENIHSNSLEPERWGSFTSNYSKDMVIKNCELNRVGAHEGVCNLTVEDTIIGHSGIRVVGHGLLSIQRCQRVGGSAIVSLRSDYGSSWNGKIILKDIVFHVGDLSYESKLIDFKNDGTHDFGYTCYYPEVEMENITVDDCASSYNGSIYLFNNLKANVGDVASSGYISPYYVKSKMTFKNMKVTSGSGFKFAYSPLNIVGEKKSNVYITSEDAIDASNYKTMEISNNLTVLIDDVEFKEIENPSSSSSHIFGSFNNVTYDLLDNYWITGDKVICHFDIKNCKNIYANVSCTPCILNLNNCVVRQLVCTSDGTLSKGYAEHCTFIPPTMSKAQVIVRPNLMDFSFIHCEFRIPKINDEEVTTRADLCKIYYFLNEFKMKDVTHMYVRCRLTDCQYYSTLPLEDINGVYKDFNFSLSDNVNFTYYFRRRGNIESRPSKEEGYDIPIGLTYYSTSDRKLYTWNGEDWI